MRSLLSSGLTCLAFVLLGVSTNVQAGDTQITQFYAGEVTTYEDGGGFFKKTGTLSTEGVGLPLSVNDRSQGYSQVDLGDRQVWIDDMDAAFSSGGAPELARCQQFATSGKTTTAVTRGAGETTCASE